MLELAGCRAGTPPCPQMRLLSQAVPWEAPVTAEDLPVGDVGMSPSEQACRSVLQRHAALLQLGPPASAHTHLCSLAWLLGLGHLIQKGQQVWTPRACTSCILREMHDAKVYTASWQRDVQMHGHHHQLQLLCLDEPMTMRPLQVPYLAQQSLAVWAKLLRAIAVTKSMYAASA